MRHVSQLEGLVALDRARSRFRFHGVPAEYSTPVTTTAEPARCTDQFKCWTVRRKIRLFWKALTITVAAVAGYVGVSLISIVAASARSMLMPSAAIAIAEPSTSASC